MPEHGDAQNPLWTTAVDRARSALDGGALQPIQTELEIVETEGLSVVAHVATGVDRKPRPAATGARGPNPFLPYDPRLFVGDLSDSHVCLLNKFSVVDHHLLIVTRRFEDQENPLEVSDLDALWAALQAIDGLGFYNSGSLAGASQPHRHLQLVPLPLPGSARFPTAAWLDAGVSTGTLGEVSDLGLRHSWASLDDLDAGSTEAAAGGLHALYRQMRADLGLAGERAPYNLLLTRQWMLMVPRRRQHCEGIELNTLAFASSVFLRRRQDLEVLRRLGLREMLRTVGFRVRRE